MKNKKSWICNFLLWYLYSLLFYGCAFNLVHVKQIPAHLNASEHPKRSLELIEEVKVSLGTGYKRRLKKGTNWEYIGKIEHGDVFKTKDQVLTIEGSNIYEAYIVVLEDSLVGFYLPIEKTYSPLSSPKKLKFQIMNNVKE